MPTDEEIDDVILKAGLKANYEKFFNQFQNQVGHWKLKSKGED
jgi:hypothetical protein